MIMEATGVSYEQAKELLLTQGSVRNATEYYYKNEAKG
jgi:N-acetylmuramic acid 6-phosphate etherase